MSAKKGSGKSNGACKRHIADEEPCSSGDNLDWTPCPEHVCHVMQNLDNIIQQVFGYLTIKSLHNMARVCQKWRDLANLEKKKRKQVSWMLAEIYRTHHVMQYLSKPINNLSSLPRVVFLAVTSELYEKKLEVPRSKEDRAKAYPGMLLIPKRQRTRISVMKYMRSLLPEDCRICGVVVDGVIGSYHNSRNVNEVEDNDAICCMMFPRLQDLAVSRFYFGGTALQELEIARGDLRPVVSGMPDSHEAVLTLLFYESAELSMQSQDPATLIKGNKTSRVVAGAYIKNMLTDNRGIKPLYLEERHDDFEQHRVTGMVFSVPEGSTDVKVASMLFDEEVNTEAGFKEKLAKLKRCKIPERNTVGFLIACCSRGELYYGKANVESSVFHQLFPKVPLVGIFGQGEVGHDYLPDWTSKASVAEWDCKRVDQLHHALCSCVILLHLGEQGGLTVV